MMQICIRISENKNLIRTELYEELKYFEIKKNNRILSIKELRNKVNEMINGTKKYETLSKDLWCKVHNFFLDIYESNLSPEKMPIF